MNVPNDERLTIFTSRFGQQGGTPPPLPDADAELADEQPTPTDDLAALPTDSGRERTAEFNAGDFAFRPVYNAAPGTSSAAVAPDEPTTLVRRFSGAATEDASATTTTAAVAPAFEGVGWLYFRTGERRGQVHQFRRERSEFGRANDSEIRIADGYASSRHGAVVYDMEKAEWKLYDFASTNGTLVNGKQLGSGEAPMPFDLSDGDVIMIGDTEMIFKCII